MNHAVAHLYRTFESYRLGDDFVGCNDCVAPPETAHLAATPVAELGVAELDRYAFKAMSTWGDVKHFKHFLPRLLELSLDHYLSFSFPEVLLGKLAYGKWETWSNNEQDAVRRFLLEFWTHQLRQPGNFPNDERIDTVLGGLAQATNSLAPFLTLWLDVQLDVAALHLGQVIDRWADEIMTRGRVSLWGDPTTQSDELVRWLASTDVLHYLDGFRTTLTGPFPFAMHQLDGIRGAIVH